MPYTRRHSAEVSYTAHEFSSAGTHATANPLYSLCRGTRAHAVFVEFTRRPQVLSWQEALGRYPILKDQVRGKREADYQIMG